AADAGAHFAGSTGGGAFHRGGDEQSGCGGRSGAVGSGGVGSSGIAEDLQVSWGRFAGGAGECAGSDQRGSEVGEGVGRADGAGGQVHTVAAAGSRQAVFDAGGGHFFDFGTRDGGHGESRAREGEGRRRDRDRRDPADGEESGDRGGD